MPAISAPIRAFLVKAAREAAANAYCPYSKYPVGAAVLTLDGQIYTGCNVENVSYGLSNCAERTALFKAVSAGCREFAALAVAGGVQRPAAPCGACRQVLYEFGPDMEVVCLNKDNEEKHLHIKELLPYGFDQTWLAIDEK